MPNRISGVISGMDTDALVKASLDIQRKPMNKINDKMTAQNRKKEVLEEQMKSLQKLKDTTLKLKLESTFLDKSLKTSNDSVVTGTASMTAVKGSYSVRVNNLAVPARSGSIYTRATVLKTPPNTVGITGVNGRPETSFEGKIDLEVSSTGAGASARYIAEATYIREGGGQIGKFTGAVAESAATSGTMAGSIVTDPAAAPAAPDGTNDLNLTVNGYTFDVNLDFALKGETKVKDVAADLEKKINDYLNTQEGTTDLTYVMVKSEDLDGTGNERLAFYNLNSNDSTDIKFNSGGAMTPLGLSSAQFSSVTEITDRWISETGYDDLRNRLNDSKTGMLPGFTVVPATGEMLTDGSATLRINSQLRTTDRIYPEIEGGDDVVKDGTLDLLEPVKDIEFNNGTLVYASDKSGTFTVNGKKITVPDMTTATVSDIIAMINSSGAGVTASYDKTNDRFMLTANENYTGSEISLGDAGDTTNFLRMAKLSLSHGGSLHPGTMTATIDPESFISDASFSETVVTGTFTINGVTLYVDPSKDSLNSLITKINDSNAGVVASYDINSDKFILKADPLSVDTNADKIEVGGVYDTSNILQALNVSYGTSSVIGQAQAGNRGVDKVVFSRGSAGETTVTVPATTQGGAYTATPLEMKWVDGFPTGTTFTIETDTGGAANSYTWTYTGADTLKTDEDFVAAWNDASYWSGSTVEVPAVLQGENRISLFNATQGIDFRITEGAAGDGSEMGLGGATMTESNGVGADATAEYNALNFTRALLADSTVAQNATITTDGSGKINMTSIASGTAGLFIVTDEPTQAANTVQDYFGDLAVKSSLESDTGSLGTDAELVVDGVFYTRTSNKVDDVIGGVELNLMSTSDSMATITVDTDTDTVLDAVTDFIFEYNRILEELNPPAVTKENRKYLTPLSEEKLDSMKTMTEVEAYEEKYKLYSKQKMIRNENSLRNLHSFLRQTVNTPMVNGDPEFDTLMDIKIEAGSVGGFEDKKKGYLIKKYDPKTETEEEYKESIKEELKRNYEFMNNLRDNPEKVFDFFAKNSEVESEKGLARRIETQINNLITTGGALKEQTKTNGYIDRQLRSLYDQYEQYEKRIKLREETLYKQFTAMEEQMARLQEQSNQVAQKLGIG